MTEVLLHVPNDMRNAGDHHGSTFLQHQQYRGLSLSARGEPDVTQKSGLWSAIVGEALPTGHGAGRAFDVLDFETLAAGAAAKIRDHSGPSQNQHIAEVTVE